MYVLVKDGQVAEYPYSIDQLKKDNSSTSFPVEVNEEILASWNVFPVKQVTPEYDQFAQKAVEGAPVLDGGEWTQSWTLVPLSEAESKEVARANANYSGFYDALLDSNIYQVIRQKALENPAIAFLCVEFVAAIGDAKNGRPNENALQACLGNIVAGASLTDAEKQGIGSLLTASNLDKLYTVA